jgi:hypothetical protein
LNSSPPPFSFISPPTIPGIVSIGIKFCIYIQAYTFFIPYSLSYFLCPPLHPFHWYYSTPGQDLFCSPVLWFYRRKKEKNDIFVCLR